ncbi:RNHCP domain-containing protein [Agromyces sp. NPDC056965]|uniref:RNHCP domain-containing protein n=1 Tax=Agromyces sp. NPDC056965 TaxID=3345983 RepID=UPI003624E15D
MRACPSTTPKGVKVAHRAWFRSTVREQCDTDEHGSDTSDNEHGLPPIGLQAPRSGSRRRRFRERKTHRRHEACLITLAVAVENSSRRPTFPRGFDVPDCAECASKCGLDRPAPHRRGVLTTLGLLSLFISNDPFGSNTVSNIHDPTGFLFSCAWCGHTAPEATATSPVRNHCPACLLSRHTVDQATQTESECLGKMVLIAIAPFRQGGWSLIHRCIRCDELSAHPVDPEDNQLVLIQAAVGPISNPPFPLAMLSGI